MLILAAVLALSPCTLPDVHEPARCGTLTVPESRKSRGGRTISLHVAVLPARNSKTNEPLFILQGGPGQAAIPLASFYAETFAATRADRDIVLIDQRGTGESNPLHCDRGADSKDLFPPAAIGACRDRLLPKADPRFYTTAEAVDDLDAVRRALGYGRINLYGTSYGTRVALEFLRRHPEYVRSAILKGVVAPELRYTVDPSLDTQASLDRVIAAATPQYPNLRAELERLPVDPDLGLELRAMLHSIPAIKRIPALIHSGDRAKIAADTAAYRNAVWRELSIGMYLSVACSEDLWRVSDAEAARDTAGTIAGDEWHRQLAGACAVWPHAVPNRAIARPVRSSVPALIISGAFDPVTPPRWGAAVARFMVNSRHVVVPNGSHSFAGMQGCIDTMMSRFVQNPDPRSVDDACATRIPLPPFD